MPAIPEAPDMADALSMDAAAPAPPAEGDLFAGPGEAQEGGMSELGEADETELDSMFAADAQDLFPDWSDDDYLKLQKLIDSRLGAGAAV